ncbi:N-glycosylase/DNA lyase [Pyrofollis japonicus]|nr:N-glycosylase/DNA lyase [Pyrofollis japonicus]
MGEALSRIPLDAVHVIESNDPQYTAVKKIIEKCGPRGVALVVANALISYRLSLPGENYWLEYANYLSTEGCDNDISIIISRFLAISRGNRMLHRQKLSRIQKASRALQSISVNPLLFRDLRLLVNRIAASLGARPWEKTIVFAAKMAYYAYRALGINVKNAEEIPLPIDRRVALLTSTSGLIVAEPEIILQRLRDEAITAWRRVSEISGMPALHLDAVIWLPAKGIEKYLKMGIEAAREEYAKRLVDYSQGLIKWDVAKRVATEILYYDIFSKSKSKK